MGRQFLKNLAASFRNPTDDIDYWISNINKSCLFISQRPGVFKPFNENVLFSKKIIAEPLLQYRRFWWMDSVFEWMYVFLIWGFFLIWWIFFFKSGAKLQPIDKKYFIVLWLILVFYNLIKAPGIFLKSVFLCNKFYII